MASFYRVFLALHIISVISWMAGILYLLRLFVYHAEETEEIVRTRFRVMERKLYSIITFPAMAASLVFGLTMIGLQPGLLAGGWLHAKLTLVVALVAVTLYCGFTVARLERAAPTKSSKFYRILNEVPTLLMVLIVFLVILRPF